MVSSQYCMNTCSGPVLYFDLGHFDKSSMVMFIWYPFLSNLRKLSFFGRKNSVVKILLERYYNALFQVNSWMLTKAGIEFHTALTVGRDTGVYCFHPPSEFV